MVSKQLISGVVALSVIIADRHIGVEGVLWQIILHESPMESFGVEGIYSDNIDPPIQSLKLAWNRCGNFYSILLASLQLVVCWYEFVVELLAYGIAAHY